MARERVQFLIRELQAEGERHAAVMLDIAEEAEALDDLLKRQGVPAGERRRQVEQFRSALESAAQFEALAQQGEAALTDLAAARADVEREVNAGLMSEVEGNQRLAAIEKERLPALRAIARAVLAAAVATKDPEAIRQAQAFGAAVDEVALSVERQGAVMKRLKATLQDALVNGLTEFFRTGIREAKSFGEAFQNLAYTVVAAVQQMLAQMLALLIVQKALGLFGVPTGGGGTVAKAEGGLIRGPGSGTSDSIPARLSNGEFVVRAEAVRRPGVLGMLAALNAGIASPVLHEFRGARRFADGGLVAGAGEAGLDSSLTVGLEDGLVLRAMKSAAGQRVIVNAIGNNRRAVGRALGG